MKDYKNKKVVVVGLARSGVAAANLLKDLGAQVWVTDSASSDPMAGMAEDLRARGIEVELGRHALDFIRNKDLIVVSPGVSDKSQAVTWADELNIPLISEIELAWSVCPATVIAVTGTNGKTTVTTLVANVLEAGGRRAFALGNIGKPFSQEVKNLKQGDFVSLEVSSFQLERTIAFKPKISVILNLAPDHLDRYSNISEYLNAKKRIFMNQDKDDYLVLNYDDPVLRDLAKEPKAKVVFFSAIRDTQYAQHRLNPNHLAVLAVAEISGVDRDTALEVFRNFKGVEHRMERVREIGQVEFINDSKATNVDSTIWALRNSHKPVILIAGGKDKNSDYRAIADLARQKVKRVVLIGQAKDKIRAHLDGVLPMQDASSLEEAVSVGFSCAKSGDCVLFSPMCASFDMFENYEHRGKVFKEIVNKL